MKNNYVAPKLTSFGNVTEMTQAAGRAKRTDAIFNADGVEIGGGDDHGSRDVVGMPL